MARYVIIVRDVVTFLVVSDGQIYSCRSYKPTKASWRRLTRLTDEQMFVQQTHHAIWLMPRKR